MGENVFGDDTSVKFPFLGHMAELLKQDSALDIPLEWSLPGLATFPSPSAVLSSNTSIIKCNQLPFPQTRSGFMQLGVFCYFNPFFQPTGHLYQHWHSQLKLFNCLIPLQTYGWCPSYLLLKRLSVNQLLYPFEEIKMQKQMRVTELSYFLSFPFPFGSSRSVFLRALLSSPTSQINPQPKVW